MKIIQNNYLVTGIPRSGSTLLMQLINQSYQNIVLSEPSWIKQLRIESKDQPVHLVSMIQKQFHLIRNQIYSGESIEVLVDNRTGKVPQNFFIRKNNDPKQIKNIKSFIGVQFPSDYFNKDLFVKNNTLFTSILKDVCLLTPFKVIIIIRDPIAVLKSWRSLNIPVSKGKLKIAELYSKEILEVSKLEPLLKRQIKLLDWFYKQYYLFRAHCHIVKYEDLIKNPVKEIQSISSQNIKLDLKLHSQNKSVHYNHNETTKLKLALNQHGKYYTYFYS